MKGRIERIFPSRGYLFIRDENGESRFANAKDFVPLIAYDRAYEGQTVEFEPVSDTGKGNGLRAVQVKPCLS